MAHTELGLQTGFRLQDVADLVMAGIDRQGQGGHLIRRDRRVDRQIARQFDGRMGQVASGVIFEQVLADPETARRRRARRLGVEMVAHRVGQALRRLEHVVAASEAAFGQARGENAAGRGLADMQRLAHGPELRFQTGRLGRGDADGGRHLRGVEAEQATGADRRTDRADGRGGVKTFGVMAVLHEAADPTFDLIAGDKGGQQIGATHRRLTGQGQNGGRHRHRWVADHGAMDVIVIEGVRGRAIDQRRLTDRGLTPRADDQRLRRAPLAGDFVEQHIDQRLVGAGDGDREPVEQAMAGHGERVGAQVGGLQIGGGGGQVTGKTGGGGRGIG